MFDSRKYFADRNKPIEHDYQKNLDRVQSILTEIVDEQDNSFNQYFCNLAQWILLIAEYENDFSYDYLLKHSFEELKAFNESLFAEIKPDNYVNSFLNPDHAVNVFGEQIGQLLCVFYSSFRAIIPYATTHIIFKINRIVNQFIQLYDTYKSKGADYQELKKIIDYPFWAEAYETRTLHYEMGYNPEFAYYLSFLENVDLNDLRYLYYFGIPITEDRIKMAEFVKSLPQEKIDRVMKQTAIAYVEGFKEGNKDYTKRKNVAIIPMLGMERFTLSLVKELRTYGFKPHIMHINPKNINKQYTYDHRFDNALIVDEEYIKHSLIESERAINDYAHILSQNSGTIYFDPFGELPFAPENKSTTLKLSPEQVEMNRGYTSKLSMMFNKAYKREETSFCIIGFPTPDIGDQFEEIFDKTIDINMLDHYEYLKIQQHLIDALDKGDYARIIGKGNNQTDLTIKLPKITNPEKETNFANCGATVNIPVGEVFNTPQLTGTHGRLHISETFLNGLFYKELTLDFVDGCIFKYSCANFDEEEENKKYIEENLIYPHKSLPIGEFAIGTNTLAYVIAKKYDILSLLPILIIEKMGPHIAIGDTCYSWEEDIPSYNPDGKEIISRDNERSLLRKEDPSKAYTQVHVDITLPYDEIELIEAVTADGRHIEIIKDSRFVLPGTEELNEAFNEL
ncbi:MAG: aminopeptidase [Candidatus Cloacimonadales bacterium]|jgi:leucyl aminopeptidase (aminopeptidase T)|nr:aminopeptidase [Candidatus Cloacimonadota bacterium]MDX9976658.1 aminopeptidase [Candidatus Cloacimonadales bacterium]